MIETHRTILRPVQPEDNQAVYSYRSDSETNKYQGWIPQTINEVDEFIAGNPDTFNQSGTWFQLVIVEKESGSVIGDMGIHFIDDHQVALGCTLCKNKQGKGIATESMTAILTYLFRNLKKHRATTSIDPSNTPSIALVKRLGFRKEAHFKDSLLVKGKWVDDVIYALLQSEWNEKQV